MADWQPIETAPRDGTRVQLKRDDCPGYDTVGFWTGSEFATRNYFILWFEPTHWAHLPTPPEVK